MSLVTDNRQFFKSSCGLPDSLSHIRETPLSHSFCQHVVTSNRPLVVEDARSDPLVSDNLAIAELGVIAYLGVPIRDREGHVLGSLCAIGNTPRKWTASDVDLMSDMGAIVEDQLLLQHNVRLANKLADENAVLAREYHHRVKNALSVAASLVRLTRREAETGEDVLNTVEGRLNALASAHNSLLSKSDDVDFAGLIERLLLPYAAAGVAVTKQGPELLLRQRQVTAICLIIHELATNSAKYGAFSASGSVSVSWSVVQPNEIELLWRETSLAQQQRNEAGSVESFCHSLQPNSAAVWKGVGRIQNCKSDYCFPQQRTPRKLIRQRDCPAGYSGGTEFSETPLDRS